jgi:sigma-B regulation protein RsbU (phosphoserine phosphatase)
VYSNAGHNHPLRLHDGTLEPLRQAEGVALGVMEGLDYPTALADLARGDVLFLYTDGVNEAMDPAGVPWGNAAMEAIVANLDGGMAERNHAVLSALRDYADGAEQSDDITLLSLRWHG